jgi:hypothetical protein
VCHLLHLPAHMQAAWEQQQGGALTGAQLPPLSAHGLPGAAGGYGREDYVYWHDEEDDGAQYGESC